MSLKYFTYDQKLVFFWLKLNKSENNAILLCLFFQYFKREFNRYLSKHYFFIYIDVLHAKYEKTRIFSHSGIFAGFFPTWGFFLGKIPCLLLTIFRSVFPSLCSSRWWMALCVMVSRLIKVKYSYFINSHSYYIPLKVILLYIWSSTVVFCFHVRHEKIS